MEYASIQVLKLDSIFIADIVCPYTLTVTVTNLIFCKTVDIFSVSLVDLKFDLMITSSQRSRQIEFYVNLMINIPDEEEMFFFGKSHTQKYILILNFPGKLDFPFHFFRGTILDESRLTQELTIEVS